MGSAWTWWWTAWALSRGQDPTTSGHVYFPVGFHPVAQYNLVDALVAAPFVGTLGPVTGYDVAVAVMFASVGFAAHLVARWEGADRASALFAGTALMCTNFVAAEVWTGRPGQAFITLLVLAVGLWLRVLRGEGSWRLAVAAGLTSALAFLEYWYYGLFVGFFAAAALYLLRGADRARWQRVALGLGVTLVGIAPFVCRLLLGGGTLPGMDDSSFIDHGALGRGEPGLNWAMESSLWPLWPVWPNAGLAEDLTLSRTLLACAIPPLLVCRGRRLAWVLAAGIGWALALGPYLQGGNGQVAATFPLPYLWLYDHLPLFGRFWWPYRAGVLFVVPMVVLGAMNLTELRGELGRWGVLLPLAAVLLNVGESVHRSDHLPLHVSVPQGLSPAYSQVDGPAITVPVFGEDSTGRLSLWYQCLHHQPILYGLGGHIAGHRPAGIDALVQENALLRALAAYEEAPPPSVEVTPADVVALREMGFRKVVVDSTLVSPARVELLATMHVPLLDAVLGKPVADDGRTRVWDLRVPDAPVLLNPAPGFVPQEAR